MPRPESPEKLMRDGSPDLTVRPDDRIPQDQKEPNIDKDELSAWLLRSFRDALKDREEFGWAGKRGYDMKAYYGIKDPLHSRTPWPNASNFPEPITPTLLDTGQSNILNSQFRDPLHTVNVRGVGPEDRRTESKVASVMNWQIGNESDMYRVQDTNAFRTLLHGTGFVKVMIDLAHEYRLKPASIPIQNMVLPMFASGLQIDETDVVHQLIPLTYNEIQFRKALGKYERLDEVAPGFAVTDDFTQEQINSLESQVTGLDVTGKINRDMYYMVETYCTWYPKLSLKPVELIVWWSINGGTIHRVVANEDMIRPFASYYAYPNPGKAYHQSLPEKIRHIQEKANYTDKQVTDAADKAISEPGYYEEGNVFDPNRSYRVPGGMYEIKKGTKVTFEQTNIAAIIERGNQIDRLWDKAEWLTSFTELFQGRSPDRSTTATSDKIRTNKAENRFSTILNRYGQGWSDTCDIIHFLNDKYMPRKKVVRILGSQDYQSVDELFPKEGAGDIGLQVEGKYDFSLSGRSQVEVDAENENIIQLTDKIASHPIFGKDAGVAWKCFKKQADIIKFDDFEMIVPKPPEAEILTVEEALQRIESGQVEVYPSPYIKPDDYIFKIKLFQKTEKYRLMDPKKQMIVNKFLKLVESIAVGRNAAKLDAEARMNPAMSGVMDEIAQTLNGQAPAQEAPLESTPA